MLPADELCAQACVEWEGYPNGYVPGSGRIDAEGIHSYEGAGKCSADADPSRTYVFPSIPPHAIRNGYIVPEQSTVTVTVAGVGTATVEPAAGHIAVSGGGCEIPGGAGCRLDFHDFGVSLPDFTIGGTLASDVQVQFTGYEMSDTPFFGVYEPQSSYPDWWSAASASGPMPLEIKGQIDGNAAGESFLWGLGFNDVLPVDDEINVRQGLGYEKFMEIIGVAEAATDGPTITVDLRLRYRFFSGAPTAYMLLTESPYSPGETILDGTGTVDELGGLPVRYEWSAVHSTSSERYIFAYGPKASVPDEILQQMAEQGFTKVCLRVYDSDHFYGESCGAMAVGTWNPQPPPPGCSDVGLSWANTVRFRELVEAAGWIDDINGVQGPFTLIVPTDALMDTLPSEAEEYMLANPQAAENYISQFIYFGHIPWVQIGQPLMPGTGAPMVPAKPDHPCGYDQTTHIVTVQ